jgi:hypothetical protein
MDYWPVRIEGEGNTHYPVPRYVKNVKNERKSKRRDRDSELTSFYIRVHRDTHTCDVMDDAMTCG